MLVAIIIAVIFIIRLGILHKTNASMTLLLMQAAFDVAA